MLGLGIGELSIILVIAMVFFGAGKLPEVGGALGKSLKNFKKEVIETPETNKDIKLLNKKNS